MKKLHWFRSLSDLEKAEKRARKFFARATPQSCRLGDSNHDEFWRIHGSEWVQKCSKWAPEDKWNFGVFVQEGGKPCLPHSNMPSVEPTKRIGFWDDCRRRLFQLLRDPVLHAIEAVSQRS